jgi:YebC/PmpR family DNA-binding regulatory protein
MGRAFEFRKERKFKRWAGMAKTFTRIGREIALAVKAGGPNAEYNSRLRLAIQNAKAANMPKTNVESAIKKASGKEAENFQEVIYEGYGPQGVAVLVETATDNPTRTVANVRMYFDRCGGALGTSGSVSYMFNRKGVFKVKAEGRDWDELELELIDAGLEEIKREGPRRPRHRNRERRPRMDSQHDQKVGGQRSRSNDQTHRPPRRGRRRAERVPHDGYVRIKGFRVTRLQGFRFTGFFNLVTL